MRRVCILYGSTWGLAQDFARPAILIHFFAKMNEAGYTYYPDFILKFTDERYLILEVKGQVKEQDQAKWAAAKEWVEAVNLNGNFGKWGFAVMEEPRDLFSVIKGALENVS